MALIVTSGRRYTDIDAYASALCYAEAMNCVHRKARAVLPGPLNYSITPRLRNPAILGSMRVPRNARCVLVDVSDPAWLPAFASPERVIAVFDHHAGHEDFWQARLGDRARIESVGAAATLIWEAIIELGIAPRISKYSAQLIATAILSNTLGLTESCATQRDCAALESSQSYASMQLGWQSRYFTELDCHVLSDIEGALTLDTKICHSGIARYSVGQLEFSHVGALLKTNTDGIRRACEKVDLVIMTSRVEKTTYLFSHCKSIKDALESKIGVGFLDNMSVVEGLIQRKRLLPALISGLDMSVNQLEEQIPTSAHS